ncbi:low affinity immunoglobulin epsilon Fc receptor-like [Babylonia areolata]|uniref:low affinity immunoglobulin epsilon Fc receptor-like n=1 Tax=Babylonia areolata TaxID=304850 RepID=UPI003FD25702
MLGVAGLVVLVVFVNVSVAQEEQLSCYDGWVKFGSSCYGFGEEYVSWAGASSLCQIFDGTLAEIETPEEQNFLKQHAKSNHYPSLWIGGTDIFSEGYFLWSGSKTPVRNGYTSWGPGEPNHLAGDSSEDCMQMYAGHDFGWNDETCDHHSPFVCEVKLEM